MTFDSSFVAQAGDGIFVAITIIGIVMALKWKHKNFKGSPSRGTGWLPWRKSLIINQTDCN